MNMKNLLVISILILFSISCADKKEFFKDADCYTNVNVIDADQGLLENMIVVIKEDRIIKVSPIDQLELSIENEIIDAEGRFMIPGLWDAHVHFSYLRDLAPSMFDLFLAYGVTSVRDTGGELNFVVYGKLGQNRIQPMLQE